VGNDKVQQKCELKKAYKNIIENKPCNQSLTHLGSPHLAHAQSTSSSWGSAAMAAATTLPPPAPAPAFTDQVTAGIPTRVVEVIKVFG
jgi:hypothetical protein